MQNNNPNQRRREARRSEKRKDDVEFQRRLSVQRGRGEEGKEEMTKRKSVEKVARAMHS
jgi:hypothetical protein